MESEKYSSSQKHEEYLAKYNINPDRAMLTLILSIIVDTFGFSMILPLLPGIAIGLGASYFMIGLFISSNAVAILIGGPIWGKLSDKFGRKSVLMISQVGTGIAFLILASANSIEVFLLSRVIDGIFSGQAPIVSAYVSDITTPQMRASKMGKLMVGYTSGMIFGPLIGGALGIITWRYPAIFASALTILSIILTFKVLVESMPRERRDDLKAQRKQQEMSSKPPGAFWTKEVSVRFLQRFLVSFTYMIFVSSYALIVFKRYTTNTLVIGTIIAVAGVSVMIYGFNMRRIISKIGEKRILFISLGLYMLVWLISPYLSELWMMYVFMLPFGFCIAFIGPLISANITKVVDADKQGIVGGWRTNFQAIAQTFTPLISTGYLQLGGLAIGLLYLNSYELIGFTNFFISVFLFIIVFIDIKHHPKLYFYERARKKRKERRKEKQKIKKTTPEVPNDQ